MPLTLEENLIGQLWSFAEVSRLNTGGGEGVEILENTLFDISFDLNGRVIFEDMPDYEDYETQQQRCKETSTSTSNDAKSKHVKKSSSKENFSSTVNTSHVNRRESMQAERSKSLDHSNALVPHTNGHHSETVSRQTLENPTHGQYTHKLYKIASKIPWFVRKLIPKDSTLLHEKSWNMYPTVKTVITNEYFRNNFRIELDTITRECVNGEAEHNVHNLTPEQLEKREIVIIDISDPVPDSDYKADEDPAIFKSTKTGRGPLQRGSWYKKQRPLICCYKLVSLEFKVFGLQTKSENYLKNMYKQLFANFHRQIFCWIDKWYGLTMEDVRKIEHDLAKLLVKKIAEGELSKNQLANSE